MRRSSRQMADTYYPDVNVSEASTWGHDYDISLPERGLRRLFKKRKARLHGKRKR